MSFTFSPAPSQPIQLAKISTRAPEDVIRADAETRFSELATELGELQELLYAAQSHSVLIVLQGLDTSGKDGTIRHVFRGVNPVGCRVASFKVPTALELSHDFLWRVHREAPERGQLALFNRSHYEDVLVVRVHDLVPASVWRKRYDHIKAFERLLADSNTIILKFYLHISKDEQERRLLERERDAEKTWKLSIADWVERRSWEQYITAYEDAINRCHADHAPWHVVPADQKWFRNLAIANTIVEALRPYRNDWMKALAARGEAELSAIRDARATKGKRSR